MKNRFIIVLSSLIFIQAAVTYRIISIELVGVTVQLDFSSVLSFKDAGLSETDIRFIATSVTDIYHAAGYTAAFVNNFVIKKEGLLEIHVREGRVAGAIIKGNRRAAAAELEKLLLGSPGDIYNEKVLAERVEAAKKRFSLSALSIKPERSGDGDIILNVMVTERAGTFYGRAWMDMIYGITPMAGYIIPFEYAAADIQAIAGYRDGKFRRTEGDAKLIIPVGGSGLFYFAEFNTARYIDRWETRDFEYTSVTVTPSLGLTFRDGYFRGDFYFSQRIIHLHDYGPSGRFYDSRINMDLRFSSRDFILEPREAKSLDIHFSGGRESLSGKPYIRSLIKGEASLFPVREIRIVPRAGFWFTTSGERFFWSYVYDSSLIGFFNDFTASRWKSTAGLDAEAELSRSFMYMGPFINSGYFLDEAGKRRFRTGTGIKCIVRYEKLDIIIFYAWDIRDTPKNGGVIFSISGRV